MQIGYTEDNKSNSITQNIQYINCLEDATSLNGEVVTILSGEEYLEKLSIIYLGDFTFEDLEDGMKILISKDSNYTMKMSEDGQSMVASESMHVIFQQGSNEEIYQSIALVTNIKMTQGGEEFYFVSGKKNINEELYSVDTDYDASKTPMIVSEDGDFLSGGKMKFFNGENHHLTLETIAKNKIKVSVDLDNDGQDDQSEILELE